MSTTILCKIHVKMETVPNYGTIILNQVKTSHIVWIRHDMGAMYHFSGNIIQLVGHLNLRNNYEEWNSYRIDNIKQIGVVA